MANPRITVEINGDSSGLHKELGKADSGVMGFAGSLKSLAGMIGVAFGAQQVFSFTSGLMKSADAARDTADALGETLKNVVGLTRLGDQAGVQQDKVLNWLQRVKAAQEEVKATNGTGASSKLLADLGVNLTDFANAGPAKGLEMIVKAAGDAGDGVIELNKILGRLSAVDVKDALGKLATEGLDKIAESAGKAADAVNTLAEAQTRLDKASAAVREKGAGFLAEMFELSALINKGAGYGEGNLASLPLAFGRMIFQTAEQREVFKKKLGGNRIGATGSWDKDEVEITGISPEEQTKIDDKKEKDAADRQKAADSLYQFDAQKDYDKLSMEELKARRDGEKRFIEAFKDDPTLDPDKLKAAVDSYKAYDKAIDDRKKSDRRKQKIIQDGAERESEIRKSGRQAIDAIQVQLPRLSGIENLGAVLGGTGGAARSAAERQMKIMEATKDTMDKIAENTQKTAEALIES